VFLEKNVGDSIFVVKKKSGPLGPLPVLRQGDKAATFAGQIVDDARATATAAFHRLRGDEAAFRELQGEIAADFAAVVADRRKGVGNVEIVGEGSGTAASFGFVGHFVSPSVLAASAALQLENR